MESEILILLFSTLQFLMSPVELPQSITPEVGDTIEVLVKLQFNNCTFSPLKNNAPPFPAKVFVKVSSDSIKSFESFVQIAPPFLLLTQFIKLQFDISQPLLVLQ